MVVPGMGTIHGFWAGSQANAIWAGVARRIVSTPASKIMSKQPLNELQGEENPKVAVDALRSRIAQFTETGERLETPVPSLQIVEASHAKPYLGLRLTIDLREVSKLMVDSNLAAPGSQQPGRGMAVGQVTTPLLDAFTRLVDLLANEQDIPILAPVIQREIAYRLLVGDQGARRRGPHPWKTIPQDGSLQRA